MQVATLNLCTTKREDYGHRINELGVAMGWHRPGGLDAQLVDDLRAGATESHTADPARLDDNHQRINSSAPQTEVEVVQRHSYGRQLGRMADALEALIEERGEGASSDERFTEFTTMKQEIDEIKLDAAATRIDQLHADLAA